MMEENVRREERKSGCIGPLKVGCFAVLAVLALTAVFVASKWGSIQEFARSSAATIAQLGPVQTAVQKKYETPHVWVTAKHNNKAPGPILSIQLVNPPFLHKASKETVEQTVRELAAFALSVHASPTDFEQVEVILTKQMGVDAALSSHQTFLFSTDELLQEIPLELDSAGASQPPCNPQRPRPRRS